MKIKKRKQKKWIKPRHNIVRNLLYAIIKPYSILKYRIKMEKYPVDKRKSYLIIYNHQTAFDQFFVGMSIPKVIYYIASEDIFSNGFISSLIRYLVAPIPFKKSTTDVRAVINCKKVVREGGSIALSPEGNRTYCGRTGHIKPSIASLVRALKLPLLIYRIEGGYGVHPRWSDGTRKGSMRGYVYRSVEPEEYLGMSDDELLNMIKDGLNVDEGRVTGEFRSKKNAEFLERVMYVCPNCGLSEFESHNDTIKCLKCQKTIQHLPTKELRGIGSDFPFRFVADWYDYQNRFIEKLDLSQYESSTMYRDVVRFSEVIPYKKKITYSKQATLSLHINRFSVAYGSQEIILPFSEITAVSVLGRNKLNIYHKDKLYQIKGNKRYNPVKYMNIYYHYINVVKGETDVEFLGL